MDTRTEKIRAAAKRLLSEGKVDVVIGYRAGTVPLRNAPYFARTPQEADNLIWDSNCRVNLATFIPRRQGKIAVVAKGCDARNILNHIVENQINRDRVYIIGVPCEGMVEPALIEARVPEGQTITEMVEDNGQITVKGRDFAVTLEKAEMLRQNCRVCQHRNPPVSDELVAEPVPETAVDPYQDLEELLAKSEPERWDYYRELVKDCIRCYACRDACPLCYCQVCFVDETQPQWVGKSQDATDVMTFHLLRAYHCAGRCTDCGACESACPMGIKVRQFTRVLEKSVKERYGYEAGLSPDEKPPLTVFLPDDPQEFIK
ncbi:MAG: Coenzyme F420 hydrogenase/dehydrogenase, beta subunit C-terminal domain [Deltaproteobacteria bacterium]|jgi:ferredoxin